jgi:pyrroloquinoline quinone biosynthesis protein D
MKKFDRHLVPAWRQGYRFQFEEAQRCYVLLYPEGMIKLNDSAGWIGRLIDGQRSVSRILDELHHDFPNVPELGIDVDDFMQVAHKNHWITLD